MKIIPAAGQAFVIEDSEDYSAFEKSGLSIPEEARKGVGTSGTIYSITHEQQGLWPRLRNWLLADRILTRFSVGQRVIFDRFIAQSIYLRDENGKEIPKLQCLPADCILGVLE